MIKKYIFTICFISSMVNAQSHDTFFSAVSSWLSNHKLGFVGLGLIGSGFLAKRFITILEKKKLDNYMRNNPVNAQNMEKTAIETLMNEKIKNGYSYGWGIGKNFNTVVTFHKSTTLGKELKDTIDLQGLNGSTITIDNSKNQEQFAEISIISTADKITVTNQGRELKNVAYADWVRNSCIGIGAIATLKSLIF